ncbi:MAG: helix-turn-helix domain-containing protein [Alphaproteobacteria bacterium]|jgi:hypothetical protein|nr:helix-turn-helix domain-containing protein [Alphaproteobacteria bacterium]MDP6588633.1 helix-turn-helix domain-containing protein [Alphaproteobacteria bacterium]MDP6819321.1 helix-turn-helix domain-containing protein [Alphaproteobacteria bacterium]|tara:strand:- start:193 stop:615 length:423 start_codon:yes stop_codon:yes gene_type:complete
MTFPIEPQPAAAWDALHAAWRRDLTPVLDGRDPQHLYPPRLSGWPAADSVLGNVLRTVADYYTVSAGDLGSKKRQRQHTEPKQIFCHIAKHRTTKSLAQIGTFIQCNPTTVPHAARAVEGRMKVAFSTQHAIAVIEARLK